MWFLTVLLFGSASIGACSAFCARWDHLVFTRQWPQAVCMQSEVTGTWPCCYIPADVDDWTIHGLWPTTGTTEKPNNCRNCSKEFDVKKLKTLQSQLLKHWPSLKPGAAALEEFWKHEWEKHGRCGVDLKTLKDEHHYFSTTLNLNKEFSLDQVLRDHEIVPTDINTYSVERFLKALRHGFVNAEPVIDCFYDKKLNRQYITQVEICISKSMTPIPCPDAPRSSNCHENVPITYPPIHPNTSFPPGCKNDTSLYFVPSDKSLT